MADTSTSSSSHDYPTIDPSSFDLVIYGTGLPESILAAASAVAGKSVLHLDPNPFYGSLFTSLPLSSFPSFLSRPSNSSTSSPSTTSSSYAVVDLQRRHIFSEIETSGLPPEPLRGYTVDLVGSRVLYCADEAVDLLLRSGGSHHVEFKSVEGSSLLYWEGSLYPVPDSRQAIFRDTTLRLTEKNRMFSFFRLVESHITSSRSDNEAAESDASNKISNEDLDIPFIDFLNKQRLPPKIRAVILYAIAMEDYDQDDSEFCKKLITREGIERIALYSSSIGRFANAVGAFIYPMYGHGELPQAFCRCAAVKGALYVLRMPVAAVLLDEEKKQCVGARLASGQDILCRQLIMDPSCNIPMLDTTSPSSKSSNLCTKVARGVCIISRSVKQDSSNVLVVFPPKSLGDRQFGAIRVLQLSSNVAVCPPEVFIAYLSTPCVDAISGKECLNAAIDALFTKALDSSQDSLETASENNELEAKPTLIWSCVYVQEITEGSSGPISLCPTPDERIDYRSILESTRKLFSDIYPNEEFLPRNSAPQYVDDDDASSE